MAQDLFADTCSICVGSLNSIGIVEVAGEIDLATVSLLAKGLADATQSGRSHVILDAQRLMYIDSAGIQTLLSTQQQLEKKGRKFAIVGCHGIFYKLVTVSKLESHFKMYSTMDEAVEALTNA